MSIQDFSKKRITVLGAGISGRSAALALARHGAEVTLICRKNRGRAL